MVTANILQRVLMIKSGDSCGTAFTIELDNKQYLISAKHIFDLDKKIMVGILKNNIWTSIEADPIICDNDNIDIIAFGLKNDLTNTRDLPVSMTLNGTSLSQDVYFLGYPYNMKHEFCSSDGFALPLVKKGIVSALGGDMIWFDGHNNPGFSGGPVVIKNDKGLQIISVISGYRKDDRTGENSGIFLGYRIDLIIEAIKKYGKL